jgi:hypothetical protein
MYEREERLIEEARRLASEATASLPIAGKGAGAASALSAIRQALTECESAKSMVSSVYQTLRCRVPATPADVEQRREELLPRAWNALLQVERQKDLLLNDLYSLQSEADRSHEH